MRRLVQERLASYVATSLRGQGIAAGTRGLAQARIASNVIESLREQGITTSTRGLEQARLGGSVVVSLRGQGFATNVAGACRHGRRGMRTDTARTLAQLTTDFYAQVSASFSATRADPWEGWERVLREAEPTFAGDRLVVLDLACGNLRFERFLDSWAARRAGEMRGASCEEGKLGQEGLAVAPNLPPDGLHEPHVDDGQASSREEAKPEPKGSDSMPERFLDDRTSRRAGEAREAMQEEGELRLEGPAPAPKPFPDVRPEPHIDAEPVLSRAEGRPGQKGTDSMSEHLLDDLSDQRAEETQEASYEIGGQRPAGPASIEAYAFDSCDDLARLPEHGRVTVHYGHLDVAEALFAGEDLAARMTAPPCDLAVCFGFMHHLALSEHREQALRALVSSVRPGGVVAVSFWQLSKSDRLLRRAEAMTSQARERLALDDLGPRDYLLGWQGRDDVLRYCHDFSEDEVDELARAVAPTAREIAPTAREIARYSADGATGDLNRYLVLRRRM